MRAWPGSLRSPRRGLIVLNVALVAALGLLTFAPRVVAQNQPEAHARARGDYTMVSGKTNLGGPAAVYIIDSANQEVVALRWDQGKQVMSGMGYRNLEIDARAIPGR